MSNLFFFLEKYLYLKQQILEPEKIKKLYEMIIMKKVALYIFLLIGLLQTSDDRAYKAIRACYKNGECTIVPSMTVYGSYLVTGIPKGYKIVLTSYFDARGKEVIF